MLRNIARRIHVKVCRRLQQPYGFTLDGRRFLLNADDATLYHIDHSMAKLVRMVQLVDSSDKVVVDVGANCGVFSALVAAKAPSATIFAFEPSDDLLPFIRANCADLNVKVENQAVGDRSGSASLYVNPRSQQTNSLILDAVKPYSEGAPISARTVPMTSIDDYIASHGIGAIDVLKIDVQGFESAVLKGARNALATTKKLFIESSWMDGQGILGLCSLARQHGFAWITVVNLVHAGADLMLSRSRPKGDTVPGLNVLSLQEDVDLVGWP